MPCTAGKNGGRYKLNADSFDGLKLSSDGAVIVEAHFFGGNKSFLAAHHVFVVLKLQGTVKLSSRTTYPASYVLLERMKEGIYCQYAVSLEDAIQLRAQGPKSGRSGWGRPWKAVETGCGKYNNGNCYDHGNGCVGVDACLVQKFIEDDISVYNGLTNNCRKFVLQVCDRICGDAYQAAREVLPEFL